VTCRSHRMQKQKFNVTCPTTIFVESVPVSPEHEKLCVDISCLGRTGVHYVTRRFHRMQKNKFCTMCPEVLFVCRHFTPQTHRNALCGMQIAPDAKTKVQRNEPQHNFCRIRTRTTRASKILCRCFTPRTQRNALRDPQIPPDAKKQVRHNMS
jgi:uncharacterized membrane protein YsdA (DUF1294 family)